MYPLCKKETRHYTKDSQDSPFMNIRRIWFEDCVQIPAISSVKVQQAQKLLRTQSCLHPHNRSELYRQL
jgi:hypothetical protein